MGKRPKAGTAIGIPSIKQRRLTNELDSHPGLHVGDCVPFYYCHRSVMLYVISTANHPDLPYRGGQDPIVHLEADFHSTVAWADSHTRRWAFTASNAGASYFQDYSNQSELNKLDWDAILSRDWQGRQEWKQAEFLIERSFPWALVLRIALDLVALALRCSECCRSPLIVHLWDQAELVLLTGGSGMIEA